MSSEFYVTVTTDGNRVSVRLDDVTPDRAGNSVSALTYEVTVAVELERDALKLAIADMARHLVRYICPAE